MTDIAFSSCVRTKYEITPGSYYEGALNAEALFNMGILTLCKTDLLLCDSKKWSWDRMNYEARTGKPEFFKLQPLQQRSTRSPEPLLSDAELVTQQAIQQSQFLAAGSGTDGGNLAAGSKASSSNRPTYNLQRTREEMQVLEALVQLPQHPLYPQV